MIQNEYILNVDIKRKFTAIVPTFVQNDTASLVFRIFDNGKEFDLSDYNRAEMTTIRKDGEVVIGLADIETVNGRQQIRYEYMGNEMSQEGFAQTSLTIFSDSGRVTVRPFKINIIADVRDAIGATEEYGLLQDLIAEISTAIENANEQGNYAKEQGDFAKEEASNLELLKSDVEDATNYANEQGNFAKAEGIKATEKLDEMTLATSEAIEATTETRAATTDTISATESVITATNVMNTVLPNVENLENVSEYSEAVEYKKNNIVSYNGSSYQALKDTIGNHPPNPEDGNSEYWSLLSRKGADGTGTVVTHRDEFISTENQKVFNLNHTYDQFQNRLRVIVGGVPQYSPDNFTETSATSFTLSEGVPAGIRVIAEYFSEAVPVATDLGETVQNHTNMLSTQESRISSHDDEIDGITQQLAEIANKAHGGVKGAYISTAIAQSFPSMANSNANIREYELVIYDTSNFYSPHTPERLTIPIGVSKVRLFAINSFGANDVGLRALRITKNGSTDYLMGCTVIAQASEDSVSATQLTSPILDVQAGDYFRVHVAQTSGGALSTITNNALQGFGIEVIE